MARRAARSKMPMEWVTQTLATTTSATTKLVAIDLDLLPDEVAEIVKIDSYQEVNPVAAADGLAISHLALSLDPSNVLGDTTGVTIATDTTDGNQVIEDLEVFFNHRTNWTFETEGTEANFQIVPTYDSKIVDYPLGLLVGTNVGMNGRILESNLALGAVLFVVTLYFKRRRASVSELNQVLLKRR